MIRRSLWRYPVAAVFVWTSKRLLSPISAFQSRHWIQRAACFSHHQQQQTHFISTHTTQRRIFPTTMSPARNLSAKATDGDEEDVETESSPRRSVRTKRAVVKGSKKIDEEESEAAAAVKKKRKGRPKKLPVEEQSEAESGSEQEDAEASTSKKTRVVKKKVKVKRKVKMDKVKDNGKDSDEEKVEDTDKPSPKKKRATKKKEDGEAPKKKAKKAKAADHQRQTDRDDVPKLWNADENKDSYTFKICSWNVAGLRALLRNNPERLPELVKENDIDVLCLQETKIQDVHLDDPKLKIRETLEKEGYESHYSCSTAKKGYSGTAVYVKRRGSSKVKGAKKGAKKGTLDGFFTKKKSKKEEVVDDKEEEEEEEEETNEDLPIDVEKLIPVDVSYKMGVDEHDAEGRIITVDFPQFSMTNVYVPNSGQKLERLDYRTKKWDVDFLAFHQKRAKDRGVPVMWVGDLNVAHTNLEVWNDGAKHLAKQAGVTQQERDSFQAQLDSGFVDAFRKLHPEAKGCYSYWSQRAGNREPNKGLRLDYFICSPELFDESKDVVVRDSYVLYDVMGSDHCPVMLELEIKK